MKMIRKSGKSKSNRTVYAQLRQATREKDGKLHITATKTVTVQDATIAQVEAVLTQAIPAA